MPKVYNNSDRGVEAIGWRFLPNSFYALDPSGKKTDHIPAAVAYSSQVKRLADQGLLAIEGHKVQVAVRAPVVEKVEAPVKEEQVHVASKESSERAESDSGQSSESQRRRDKNRGR